MHRITHSLVQQIHWEFTMDIATTAILILFNFSLDSINFNSALFRFNTIEADRYKTTPIARSIWE